MVLPNPWLEGPKPESTEQPDLMVTLRFFTNFERECHSGSYPYKLHPEKPHRIHFFEIIGKGPPPEDVLPNPGDVYVDCVPPCLVYVGAYGGSRVQWKLWNHPEPDGPCSSVGLFPHPTLTDRFLWENTPRCNSRPALSWFARGSLRRAWGIGPNDLIDPTEMLNELYGDLSEEPIDTSGKRRRSQRLHMSGSLKRRRLSESRSRSQITEDSSSISTKYEESDYSGEATSDSDNELINKSQNLKEEPSVEVIEQDGNTAASNLDPASENAGLGAAIGQSEMETWDELGHKLNALTAFIPKLEQDRLLAKSRVQHMQKRLNKFSNRLKDEKRARVSAEQQASEVRTRYTEKLKEEKETRLDVEKKLKDAEIQFQAQLAQERTARETFQASLSEELKKEKLATQKAAILLQSLTAQKEEADEKLAEATVQTQNHAKARLAAEQAFADLKHKLRDMIG
ncbi:hypothetical protein Hypma_006342 [Hypsizygus marmoreus]|uniref:Uncharacterized protein n=1 Tax=Hypsizygus marmoreus TaxID=39966 RepID=A0A369JU73_HYPMA|nr:hypothetical protein Hypma_006342 [Hypsizygus marmoreus]